MAAIDTNPFPAYVQEIASIAGADLSAFDPSELLPVITVIPENSVGKLTVNRNGLEISDSEFNPEHVGPSGAVGVIDRNAGMLVDYQTAFLKFPKSRVHLPTVERSIVNPDVYDEQTVEQITLLAFALYRRAVGVFTAANYPDAAFTSLGDGAKIDSAAGSVLSTLQLHMEACEDANGSATDRLIIGMRAARAIGRNTTILARQRVTVDQHELKPEAVRMLLEDYLGLDVVISRAAAKVGGSSTFLWDSEIAAFTYYGKKPPKPANPVMDGSDPVGFSFPGQSYRARKNDKGRLPVQHCSAIMVMEAFRSLTGESVITDASDAASWAVAVERETLFTDLLGAMASIDVPVVDALAGRIMTDCMT